MEFLTQRREGAKIVNSLTLRLCVRLFPRLSAHAVSCKSQIGGVHREASGLALIDLNLQAQQLYDFDCLSDLRSRFATLEFGKKSHANSC